VHATFNNWQLLRILLAALALIGVLVLMMTAAGISTTMHGAGNDWADV
jgi:hypothetical protein